MKETSLSRTQLLQFPLHRFFETPRWKRTLGLVGLMAAFLLCCGAPRAAAQNVYAAIHGTVTDASGAVVPGAKVTVLNTGTGTTAIQTTDDKGYYVFPELATGGPYTVTVEKQGFKSVQTTGLNLTLNQNYEQDARLEAGAVSQTVEVSANAVQVDTSDTQLKATFGATQIEQLPLLGRDASIVQKFTPGTVESSDRFGNYSSNGSQTQENSYLLDGADINDAPLQTQGFIINPDALGEITLLTSTQSPEYSRNSGAIINESVKSGTNQFHGEGFEFYRDTFLNNGSYFSSTRPKFHQNLFGGTLGGPVLRNRLFFFVGYQGFHNASGTNTLTTVPLDAQLGRNGSGFADLTGDSNNSTGGPNSAGLSTNPVPFAIAGPNGACGPGTASTTWAACFSGGTVDLPVSDFGSISNTLLSDYVPSPNDGNKYNFNSPNTTKEDQGVIRVDAHITQSDTLWAENIFQSEPSFAGLPFTGATLPGFGENSARHFKVFDAAWTHMFNSNTLNSLRVGYFRFNFAAVEPAKVQLPSSLGFDINPEDPAAASIPKITVAGYFTLGFSNNGPQPRIDANEDFADNFTKVAGAHNLMFGAHLERFAVHNPFFNNLNGNFGFSGSGSYSSGDPLLDFLVGVPDSYAQGSGAIILAHAWEDYAYAQDNWKITRSLSLNYGIGWDVQTPFSNEQYGGEGIICWVPGAQSKVYPGAQPGLLYPKDSGCNSHGGPTTKYDHFAPRMGFDWSPESGLGWMTGPAGQHLFAVRGGIGLYYNRDSEEAQLQNLEDPPYGLNSQGAGGLGGSPSFANPFQDVSGNPAASEANPYPYAFPTPGQNIDFSALAPYLLSTISPSYDVPYAYNFNLNVQRQLPGNELLQVAYVGSLGRKLVRAYEANRLTAAGHANAVAACQTEIAANGGGFCSNVATLLPFLQPQDFTDTTGNYISVGRVYTDGASSYHALQASLEKQMSHGLYFNIGYTWSHALDNGSSFESAGFGNSNDLTGTNWVPGFQQLSYGNSEYDARHRLFAVYQYVVPLTSAMRQNYILNEALGGWHVSGYTVLQSGNPASIGEPDDNRSLWCNSDAYFFYECPDTPQTSNFHPAILNPRKGGNYWFDTTPFSLEPVGTFGNVKRNFLHGPGFNYTDMTLFKDFPLGRADSARYVEVRLESFNLFNHANFENPDGSILDGSEFGEITNVVQPVADGGNGDPQPGRAVQLGAKVYF